MHVQRTTTVLWKRLHAVVTDRWHDGFHAYERRNKIKIIILITHDSVQLGVKKKKYPRNNNYIVTVIGRSVVMCNILIYIIYYYNIIRTQCETRAHVHLLLPNQPDARPCETGEHLYLMIRLIRFGAVFVCPSTNWPPPPYDYYHHRVYVRSVRRTRISIIAVWIEKKQNKTSYANKNILCTRVLRWMLFTLKRRPGDRAHLLPEKPVRVVRFSSRRILVLAVQSLFSVYREQLGVRDFCSHVLLCTCQTHKALKFKYFLKYWTVF